MKTMLQQKKTRITVVILFVVVFCSTTYIAMSESNSWYITDGKSEYFVIYDLEINIDYNITIASFSEYIDYDIGFTIHKNDDFDNNSKFLTVDHPGLGTESTIFSVNAAGDYYLEIWINGDSGIVDFAVEESESGQDVMVGTYHTTNDKPKLLWLWLTLGIGGAFTILFVVIFVVVGSLAGKKMLEEAKKIDFNQVENPLTVIKKRGKRICPYCRIKIPEEAQVTCPYCGAPITEEENL